MPNKKGNEWIQVANFPAIQYFRGILVALSIASSFAGFFSLDVFQGLRFFHSVVVGWNRIAAYIGELIGRIPWIPDVPPLIVNILIVVISIGLPSYLGLRQIFGNATKDLTGSVRENVEQSVTKQLEKQTSVEFERGELGIVFIYPVFLILVGNWFIYLVSDGDMSFLNSIVGYFFLAFFWLTMSILRVASSKVFHGVASFFVIVATLELLHFLNLPLMADAILQFTNDVLGPAPG